ncbi:hypothetical protein G5I_07682 [Acromyrmex echinatior]|uniref:Uncharacterized protein n=1 Tax=Acromyrmex echinatior TaxID=103372 RepID=F4WPG8_ACREC|nr:hypothetical protein G5I_07682 [Acromyrmex echinatior]
MTEPPLTMGSPTKASLPLSEILKEQLMLVGSDPQSETNMPPHPQRYMPQLPSTSQRSCPENGDGKTQQRLQGFFAGISNFASRPRGTTGRPTYLRLDLRCTL